MQDITLSVKRSRFRSDDPYAHEADSKFKKIRQEVLNSQDFTCQFCDFRSLKFQHVHHIDDNHQNNNKNNLITACPLCHMCHHVGYAGEKQMGVLIHIDPEIKLTQNELNDQVRMLWIGSMSSTKEIAVQCENYLQRIYNMNTNARRLLMNSDLTLYGDFLMGLSKDDYAMRSEKMKGFYFLPLKSMFKRELEYWRNECKIPGADSWEEIAKQKFTDMNF